MIGIEWGLPPQAYLFGDWTVPWVIVISLMGLFYLWAKFGKDE